MSTTAQTSSRMALKPIKSSTLNARLFTTSFSSNLKAIIDRTPQLKRSLTVDVGFYQNSKKFCNENRELVLPSPLPTPKTRGSFSPKRKNQASMLKARLQMAYYKIKHQKTQVPAKELLESFQKDSKTLPPVCSFPNVSTTSSNGTPSKKKGSDLLASSTPIPVSIFKNRGIRSKSLKSVNFQTTDLRHPFLPKLNYTSSSPSRFVTSLPPISNAPPLLSKSKPTKKPLSSLKSVSLLLLPKRTLKAPLLPNNDKSDSIKLPPLYEVTSTNTMNTSTPLHNKGKTSSTSENLPLSKDFLTPVKVHKKRSLSTNDTTQLMSSPSIVMTTPSSMGAAKSLLQLAFVEK